MQMSMIGFEIAGSWTVGKCADDDSLTVPGILFAGHNFLNPVNARVPHGRVELRRKCHLADLCASLFVPGHPFFLLLGPNLGLYICHLAFSYQLP